ncbi:sialic acid-binding Ig-like lectin 13 isoform X2 [Heptranchias perlo]|uniref:sialic acid-binding Ig-like lectin 13 isoform X2 n=1 Tax=Heptranchias perlo TaxID=212740 RepID=UPI00355A3013
MDIHPFLSDQSQHNARFPDRMSSVTAQDQEKSPASSKGEWKVTAPQNITTVRGSCVTIPCSFKYPRDLTPDKMVKIWFKSHDSWPNVVSHSTDPEAAMAEFRHRARFLDELGQTNCTLRVWNVSKADESCYLFRVEVANKAKSKFTYKNFPVCIHVFDSPDNPVLSDPGEIIEGIPSRLRCTVYSNCSPWPPEIRWSGLGGLIPTTQSASEHWQYSSVVTIVPSYQDHGKRIHCRVDNVDLKTSSEKIVRLRVRYSPKNTSVIISGKEGAMKEGDNISLTCFTDSNPKPHNYTWFKVHGNETINLNQFTKNVMLARDNWTYYCKAINSVGFGTSPSTTISISELSNDKRILAKHDLQLLPWSPEMRQRPVQGMSTSVTGVIFMPTSPTTVSSPSSTPALSRRRPVAGSTVLGRRPPGLTETEGGARQRRRDVQTVLARTSMQTTETERTIRGETCETSTDVSSGSEREVLGGEIQEREFVRKIAVKRFQDEFVLLKKELALL